ncbi:hypothetical protein [Psychrobacter sp. H8-1]|uniref:hypothetical protein n=1 Tax=Psychrobacter sp. H8-1 TaxID=2774129 RepID=UPI001D1302BB|nr:hypothetical protein [Psychrobacter sp. H8-1]
MRDSVADVEQAGLLRIDTVIKPNSYLRTLLYSGLIITIIILAWFAQLLLWHYVLVVIISVMVVSYLALSRPILLHLSQPPLDKQINKDWQLLMRTGRGDELWLADLNKVNNYSWLISLSFETIEPFKRSLTVIIYRDQVSMDEWRQLMILANVIDTP